MTVASAFKYFLLCNVSLRKQERDLRERKRGGGRNRGILIVRVSGPFLRQPMRRDPRRLDLPQSTWPGGREKKVFRMRQKIAKKEAVL